MSAAKSAQDHRRYRLATNDNETVVDDEQDTEGHRLATNDNETTVPKMRRIESPDEGDEPLVPGARRIRAR